jgi:esterase/lipase superfamily enzyme
VREKIMKEQAAVLISALARVWSELPVLVGSPWPELESRLLFLLRDLDVELEGTESDAAEPILRALENFPLAYRRLNIELPRIAKGGPIVPKIAAPIKFERYVEVPVFYATDREAVGRPTPDNWFSGRRGTLSYGIARVSIPDDHRMGRIEKPRWWRLEFRPDPERHVVLLSVEPFDPDQFVEQSKGAVAQAGVAEGLIFVHGYNVTFADAAQRTAQIAYDLGFKGLPCMYSWPSEGVLDAYLTDGENSKWTVPHFCNFLRLLREDLGLSNIHVIAHSMGNRVVTEALCRPDSATEKPGAARLRHLVLAAPDIDAAVFGELAEQFHKQANRCTLYASSADWALTASTRFVGYPRAGLSGDTLVVIDGIDTIDASLLDTGLMGHSYIGDNTSILSDVHGLILKNEPPDGRFGLKPVVRGGKHYWLFRPQ